ncbi:MAG: O-antigen ligase family protein, partial [Acidobacteriota bacterium]|nr:O-antigen ligase family protein [Acidobacteriota bacterium]
MLSCILSFATPVLLAAYWPLTGLGFTWVPAAVRAGLIATAGLFAILWWKAGTTRTERQWAGVLMTYLGLLLLDSLLAVEITRALQNSVRILFLLAFCLVLARAFRHPATRRAFGTGALVSSLLLSAYILGCYVHFLGTALPTYESTRIFKATVSRVLGVGLNPLGFSTAFFCMLASCTLRSSWVLNLTLAAVICICSVFTGSRTPLALMIVSFFLVAVVELSRRKPTFRSIFLFVLLPVLVIVCGFALRDGIDMRRWSIITENRTDLWTAAWAKFTERPLTGYGADSWADDLISRLPALYQLTAGLVKFHAGGYHNAYFTLLAEEGIFVFAFALYMLVNAFRTLGQSSGSNRQDRTRRAMLLFALIFLVLRGFIEVPGLFGYGEDPAEFASYALLALIISSRYEARVNHKSKPLA